MASMTPEQRDAFLRQPRIAKLATLYADGWPSVVPIWFEWDGAGAWFFSSRTAPKMQRIRADPRVSLTVEEGVGVPEAWVSIEGEAAEVPGSAIDLAARLARLYYKPDQAERTIERWTKMADEFALVRITPRRIRSLAPES
jgi:PPOX class probable F420-dependent enzyme